MKITIDNKPPIIWDTITVQGIEFTVTKTIDKKDFIPFEMYFVKTLKN